jgi:hypothetical protein
MEPAVKSIESSPNVKIADQKGRITLGSKYAGKYFSVREDADGTAVLIPVEIVAQAGKPITSGLLAENFGWLESLEDDWDGHGSAAPSPEVIEYAREVFALIQASALARCIEWTGPHVGCNERGQISLEWWNKQRTLTVFVRSAERVDFLKSWGANIETEMEDGEVNTVADFVTLARWLYRDEDA